MEAAAHQYLKEHGDRVAPIENFGEISASNLFRTPASAMATNLRIALGTAQALAMSLLSPPPWTLVNILSDCC